MPAPISIVIPTLNAGADLGRCAVALAEGLDAGLIRELVVSDGGSADTTLTIADELGANVVTGAASRGGQIGRGVAAAKADWLMILHADTVLDPGWTQAVALHLRDPARAGYFRLRFRAAGLAPRIVAGWANLRARRAGLPYGDQGLVIHRDLLARVGGVPDLPLMEDVALARALRGRLVMLGATAATSAARYQADGWTRRSLRNGLTLARYLTGTPPERLRAGYSKTSN
ncbi:MAG: TIGR04283 family arsenosugar biosynthesis glycosyltransferase [Pseudomonadota bacterium]